MAIIQQIRRISAFLTSRWGIAIIVVVVFIAGGYWFFGRAKTSYQFVAVTSGPITETVSVTGNTSPTESVSLGFRNSGTIAYVYHKVGDRVSAGDVIAGLDTASLSAALQQAQAAYDSAVASRSSKSLPETDTEARNTYVSAYTTLDTTLHDYVDTLFGWPTAYGPQFLINDPMYTYGELSKTRETLDNKMETYRQTLPSAQKTDPTMLLAHTNKIAIEVSDFLNKIAVAANDRNSGATSAQLTALSTARLSIDTLLAKLSTARDTYRTNSVGATSLADASVAQAAAGVAVAKANLQGTQIIAPINGVVTQQDAKVGQVASVGAPLVAIISASSYEIEAGIPETDIGKVAVGNPISMTLDAFPGETFKGIVFYIDPAQTVSQGAVDYKIKVSFDKPDPRMKSGLTANLDIATRHRDSALLLPQYAILQNDSGTFVKVLENGAMVTSPIMLGIQDKNGIVEIVKGVTEGEQVLNIGLKQ